MSNRSVLIVFFLFVQSVFGQTTKAQENQIYQTIDQLVANPSVENIEKGLIVVSDFWKTKPLKSNNELLAIVILNCNLGFYQNQLGKTTQAIVSYEKAWQVFEKNKLQQYDIIEYCLKPLGNLYTITGDYDNAQNTIKQYYFMANHEPEYKAHKIAAILNLSNVYQSAGSSNLSIDLLENALANEKLSSSQKGILFNNLGSNYMLNSNFGQAKKALTTALFFLKKDKDNALNLSNSYRNLSTIYAKEQHFKEANSYFEQAQKIIATSNNSSPRGLAKLYLEEASLLFDQKKLKETAVVLSKIFKVLLPNYKAERQFLPAQNSLFAETALLDALDLQALVYFEQNEYQKALQCYERSFYIEELFQLMLVYENSKIINLVRNRNRTEKCIIIYDLLYQKEKNSAYITKAFLSSEQSKAAVLKNYTTRKIPNQEKIILEQIQNWNTIIIKEQQKEQLANIVKINEAIKRQNELMLSLKALRKNTPFEKSENIDLNDLFDKLDKDNASMVCYFWGTNNVYSFTIESGKITLQTLQDANQLKALTDLFLSFFKDSNAIANNPSQYNHIGNLLYNYLRLKQSNRPKNLVIVPDGILNFLPFEALITQRNTTSSFAKMRYFLNDYNISYDHSASFYMNSKLNKSSGETVLGVFPIFEKTNLELLFSKEEMTAIQKNFEGEYLTKNKATFKNFKKYAKKYAIIHLSTHASAGDVIDPSNIKFYDQEVLYSELYNLNINPNLVVLSACETGLGKLYKGEGAMSVARGFQVSGAQNILLSLWKVNDFTTSKLMGNFYQNIHDGMSYKNANYQSKLQFLNDPTVSNSKKSPYYWAPFVYYGTLENNTESKLWLWALGLLSIGIVGFFFWNKFKK
jgi:CHAT domain-containing protein